MNEVSAVISCAVVASVFTARHFPSSEILSMLRVAELVFEFCIPQMGQLTGMIGVPFLC